MTIPIWKATKRSSMEVFEKFNGRASTSGNVAKNLKAVRRFLHKYKFTNNKQRADFVLYSAATFLAHLEMKMTFNRLDPEAMVLLCVLFDQRPESVDIQTAMDIHEVSIGADPQKLIQSFKSVESTYGLIKINDKDKSASITDHGMKFIEWLNKNQAEAVSLLLAIDEDPSESLPRVH